MKKKKRLSHRKTFWITLALLLLLFREVFSNIVLVGAPLAIVLSLFLLIYTCIKKNKQWRRKSLYALSLSFAALLAGLGLSGDSYSDSADSPIEQHVSESSENTYTVSESSETADTSSASTDQKMVKLLAEAEKAVEKAEKSPTKDNHATALQLVKKITENQDLLKRLDIVNEAINLNAQKEIEEQEKKAAEEQRQQEISEKILAADAAMNLAETNPTRENYNSAQEAFDAVPGGNSGLAERLKAVEEAVTESEKQSALQAEADRIAAEKAAAQQAENDRVAAEQQQANEQIVYIAPDTGTKYHSHSGCSGLSNANSVVGISINEIGSRTPCKKCH